MSKTHVIGIDLGTSNSTLALAECDLTPEGVNYDGVIEVEQIFAPGVIGKSTVLPSAIYIPLEGEFSSEAMALPWQPSLEGREIAGQFAKERGATVPDRLITSAKSWLCHSHVNRREAILPWRSDLKEKKLSPVAVSRLILSHLKSNFENKNQGLLSAGECAVVVTVPASFDEVARALTYQAAEEAGLKDVTLIEEPQAAFYSWISENSTSWREQIKAGDVVLVCDVGGGTADFSLIAVSQKDGELSLERISVGDHILLGGDNMDLALAYTLKFQLEAEGKNIDQWQLMSLVHLARVAKERLFSDPLLDEVPISLPSRGSSLFAQSISTKLARSTLIQVVLDGFFPLTDIGNLPQQKRSAGLQEYDLPYASDPVLSKHLARFLSESKKNIESDPKLRELVASAKIEDNAILPTAVLFNGGVFNSNEISSRVLELLQSWNDGKPIKQLRASSLELAVARGAAYYGAVVQSGKGLRIKAGTARSFYLGLEVSMPAVPGFVPPIKGVCVVPQGAEEGHELSFEKRDFGLVVGEQVEFRFFSSHTRAGDEVGSIIENAASELEESTNLEVTIPAEGFRSGEIIPVNLHAIVNEVGILELWMQHKNSPARWKLEFNVRGTN